MSEEQKQSYFRIRTNPMRIRQAASMNLNGYWWIYFIGIFVYYFFSDILINIVSRYFPSGYMVIPMSNLPEEIQKSVAMPQIPVVLFFYVLLMSGAFELGRAVDSAFGFRRIFRVLPGNRDLRHSLFADRPGIHVLLFPGNRGELRLQSGVLSSGRR